MPSGSTYYVYALLDASIVMPRGGGAPGSNAAWRAWAACIAASTEPAGRTRAEASAEFEIEDEPDTETWW